MPPFHDLPNEYRVVKAILSGTRPPRPPPAVAKGPDEQVWNMIGRCWGVQPAQRPSAQEIVEILSSKVHPILPVSGSDEAVHSRLISKMSGNSLADAVHPTTVRERLVSSAAAVMKFLPNCYADCLEK
jgi:hypothetical protein